MRLTLIGCGGLLALLVLFVACAALIGSNQDTDTKQAPPEETTVFVEKTVEKTVALPPPAPKLPPAPKEDAPTPEPEPTPDPTPDPDPADVDLSPKTPAVPNLQSGANCSAGAQNVPVVPGSKGDRDGDGIACES